MGQKKCRNICQNHGVGIARSTEVIFVFRLSKSRVWFYCVQEDLGNAKNIPIYNQWLQTAQRSQCRNRCGKKMQGLTKVNIPLLKHDPTCMLLSKLKPGWLLQFGLYQYQFVLIVVPCLVYSGVGIHSFEKVRTKNCRCLDAKLLSKQAILLSKLPNAMRTRIIVWKEQRSAGLLDVTA